MNPQHHTPGATTRAGTTASRVRLVALGAHDEAEFLAAVAASRRLHGRWVSPPADAARFQALLTRSASPAQQLHLLRRRDDGALVGVVDVTNIVRGVFLSAYLGYYAFEGQQGQGLMQEGLRLAIRHAFGPLGLHRLEANIQPANQASIALVKACGFSQEGYSPRYLKIRGRWTDHERWALLADDPRPPGGRPPRGHRTRPEDPDRARGA